MSTTPLNAVRVTGALVQDARFVTGAGHQPHAWLWLDLQPDQGLPYHARVDLGDDIADHMAAEATLPQLRRGALVSVGGSALQLRSDHGHPVLNVLHARHVLVLQPAPTTPTLHPSPDEAPHAH